MCTPNETIVILRSRGRRVGGRLLRMILTSDIFTLTRRHEILHQRMYAAFGIPSESISYLGLSRKQDRLSISGHCIAVGRIPPSKLLFVNILQITFDVVHVLMMFGPRAMPTPSSLIESLTSVCNESIPTAERVRRSSLKYTIRELGDTVVAPLRSKIYHTKRDGS